MKKILLFLILCFISFPSIVLADDYKVCSYDKKADLNFKGTLHVVGNTVKFDMYNGKKKEITKDVSMNPEDLLKRCPASLCEGSVVTVCSNGRYVLKKETTESVISGLNEALSYQYGDADPSKVSGMNTILNGGCPTDEGIFKLLKVAYDLIKIAAPIMVALFATIDLAKAAAASDDSAIKKAQKHCMKRIAAAVVLFLSFAVVEMFVKMVSGGSEIMSCISSFLN